MTPLSLSRLDGVIMKLFFKCYSLFRYQSKLIIKNYFNLISCLLHSSLCFRLFFEYLSDPHIEFIFDKVTLKNSEI